MNLQTDITPTITLGSTVQIRDLETNEREIYTLTKPSDADIRQNRISTVSPIGRALYGQQPGHIVEVEAPGGIFLVEIEAVEDSPELQYPRDG